GRFALRRGIVLEADGGVATAPDRAGAERDIDEGHLDVGEASVDDFESFVGVIRARGAEIGRQFPDSAGGTGNGLPGRVIVVEAGGERCAPLDVDYEVSPVPDL